MTKKSMKKKDLIENALMGVIQPTDSATIKYLSNAIDSNTGEISKPFTIGEKSYQMVRGITPEKNVVLGVYCFDDLGETGENIIHPVDYFEKNVITPLGDFSHITEGKKTTKRIVKVKDLLKGGKLLKESAESTLTIDIKKIGEHKHRITVNGRPWSKNVKFDRRSIGDKIINVLFYLNKDGDKKIKIIIDGKDETEDFKKEVIEKYSGTGLSHFLDYLGPEQ